MKRTPLKRKTPLRARVGLKPTGLGLKRCSLTVRTRLRPVGVKKAAWNRRYAAEKKVRLKTFPLCQRCNRRRSEDGHHPYGQAGKMILLFVAVCRCCHDEIHGNPNMARATGWVCDGNKTHPYEHPHVVAARIRAEILWREVV